MRHQEVDRLHTAHVRSFRSRALGAFSDEVFEFGSPNLGSFSELRLDRRANVMHGELEILQRVVRIVLLFAQHANEMLDASFASDCLQDKRL